MINFSIFMEKVTKILSIVWKAMKKFVIWMFQSVERVVAVALGVTLIVFWFNYKKECRNYEKKLKARNELVTEYKNKAGELYDANLVYETTVRDLKKSNSELAEEVKNLKDNPLVITKTKTVIEYKDVEITDTVYVNQNDSTFLSKFNFTDDWANIEGYTSVDIVRKSGFTHFNNISISQDLTLDVVEKDANLLVVAKSDNPYVKINTIEGALISPEKIKSIRNESKQKWAVVAGVGPAVTVVDNTIKLYPALNVTIGYKLIGF